MQKRSTKCTIAQAISTFPCKTEVHAQEVQHGSCQCGLPFIKSDYGYFMSAFAGSCFQPADTIDHITVRRDDDRKVNAKSCQHPPHISCVAYETVNIPLCQSPDLP